MGEEEELWFWRQMWKEADHGLAFSTAPGTGCSMPMCFCAILLILTPDPRWLAESRLRHNLSMHELAEKMSDFELQFNGVERDVRGYTVDHGRSAIKDQSLQDLVYKVMSRQGPTVADIQYRVTASHTGEDFNEQVGSSIITAIVALREACANYDLFIGDDGTSLSPVMPARRCLGCGKKNKGKRKWKLTCYPRLIQGLVLHIDEGCVHNFFEGAKNMKFEHYVNVEDTMTKWWNKRQRVFVVYVSECGHHGVRNGGGVQYFDTPAGGTPEKRRSESDTYYRRSRCKLSDPQVPWWTGCEYEIEHDSKLITSWTELDRLINEKSAAYPTAVRNAREPGYNMTDVYRWLRNGMDERIERVFNQPNYGR
eukprot:5983323-Amphidinium_carterae.4